MVKKSLVLFIFLVIFSLIAVSVSALNETERQPRIDSAYSWLQTEVGDWKALTSEEAAFALLALNYEPYASAGKTALLEKSKDNECWPKDSCKIKDTALAFLALSTLGQNTEKIENWLLNQEEIFLATNVKWYLQIDSEGESNCNITYDDIAYDTKLNEDKTFSKSAGSCLPLSYNGYWLEISSNCLEKEFTVTCDKDFVVSLLHTKGDTLYVSGESKHRIAYNSATVKIKSVCLQTSGNCDYEGTAWATFALNKKGIDVSSFLPYLSISADTNNEFLPNTFLYLLRKDIENAEILLSLQTPSGYWSAGSSYGKKYDTALALLALKDYEYADDNIEKVEEWLFSIQDNIKGSFETVRDTAFILYAVWPRGVAAPIINECESYGGICKAWCDEDEEEVEEYSLACTGVCCAAVSECENVEDCVKFVCDGEIVEDEEGNTGRCEYLREETCDDDLDNDADGDIDMEDSDCIVETCYDLDGEECDYDEICKGGTMKQVYDTDYCCVDGYCASEEKCEDFDESEVCEIGQECTGIMKKTMDTDYCCVNGKCKSKKNLLWLIITLLIITILVILYLFLKRKHYTFKRFINLIKFKRKPKPTFPPPLRPISRPVTTGPATKGISRLPLRKMPIVRRRRTKTEEELEETLEKLKKIGKK